MVLKDERRNLYQDVAGLFDHVAPQQGLSIPPVLVVGFPRLALLAAGGGSGARASFPGNLLGSPATRRNTSPQTSDWIWATTLSPPQVPTERIVRFGHQRWDIENHGFNELVNEWHADHLFKHDPDAIECFLLVAFLAYNIFHAFLARNVKPSVARVRRKSSGPDSSLLNSTVR